MTDDEIYEYLRQEFEWDRRKAALNVLRHEIRFTEAATVIFDQDALYEPDPDHSEDELLHRDWPVDRPQSPCRRPRVRDRADSNHQRKKADEDGKEAV